MPVPTYVVTHKTQQEAVVTESVTVKYDEETLLRILNEGVTVDNELLTSADLTDPEYEDSIREVLENHLRQMDHVTEEVAFTGRDDFYDEGTEVTMSKIGLYYFDHNYKEFF